MPRVELEHQDVVPGVLASARGAGQREQVGGRERAFVRRRVQEAQRRRRELEEESSFFGSMDGASKFVRGDAVAGLIITFINAIGGILIGTLQHGMPAMDAANTYVQLTIGDGLVTQVPAIVISIAAGFLVFLPATLVKTALALAVLRAARR